MKQNIIGRKREIQDLEELYNSGRAEFVAVYGRRRVGKTFLIRELFSDRFAFYHTGLSPAELSGVELKKQQLQAFHTSLVRYGDNHSAIPGNWLEAFDRLSRLLEKKEEDRLVVFLDELPWMDTPKSGFITALEHFWNGWASGDKRIMLVACGSSTSWISDKLVNNHGGLYGRLTGEIKLSAFTLGECEEYFSKCGMVIDRYDQLQCYMVFGGIPYYLSLLKRGLSISQNIDRLFFSPDGALRMEFDRLFASVFANADDCKAIVTLLATRRIGFTRKEIAERTRLAYGGGLTTTLRSLIVSDFVTPYVNFGHNERHTYYRLSDLFSMFYLHFLSKRRSTNATFWQNNVSSPAIIAWRGFAFEAVCFSHIAQIKRALGITGVQTEVSPWHSDRKSGGAQIDMVISRADRVINLCEMKFSSDDFRVDAAYDKELRHKLSVFNEETGTRCSLHMTLVTTYGLGVSAYRTRFQSVVSMEDLFV